MITLLQFERYLDAGRMTCLHCGSIDIIAGIPQPDGEYIYVDIHCPSCNTKWQETYRLYRVGDDDIDHYPHGE